VKILSRCLLTVLIIGIGILAIEITILLKTNERTWWAAGAPTLGAYFILLLGVVFRRQDNPLSQAVRFTVEFMMKNPAISAVAAFSVAALATWLGIQLYQNRDPPDGVYRIYAYSGVNAPGRRVKGLSIIFEVQAPVEHKKTMTASTSADGIAEFPTDINDHVTVRAQDENNRFYVIDTRSITQDDLVVGKPVNLDAIDPEDWLSPQPGAPVGVPVSWMPVDAGYLATGGSAPRLFGSREGIDSLSALGPLPSATVVVSHSAYVAGFEPNWHLARWVAYEIKGRGEDVRRRSGAIRDPLLPAEWQANADDYRGTGYDRGRLVSTDDAALTQQMESELRYFGVVAPMSPGFNRTLYGRLKRHTTGLKKSDGSNRVFVIRGPAFLDEKGGRARRLLTIGASRLPVPTHFFQIAAIVEKGGVSLDCFLLPNLKTYEGAPGARGPVGEGYRSSRAAIEAATGLRFLPKVRMSGNGCQ
jgi:DNA/RNA endonuclease G (NUC1)